jgi:hypothetical protein
MEVKKQESNYIVIRKLSATPFRHNDWGPLETEDPVLPALGTACAATVRLLLFGWTQQLTILLPSFAPIHTLFDVRERKEGYTETRMKTTVILPDSPVRDQRKAQSIKFSNSKADSL